MNKDILKIISDFCGDNFPKEISEILKDISRHNFTKNNPIIGDNKAFAWERFECNKCNFTFQIISNIDTAQFELRFFNGSNKSTLNSFGIYLANNNFIYYTYNYNFNILEKISNLLHENTCNARLMRMACE